ncbi:hypothetical protein STAS_03088 [Striga asiatica]|uniref:Uncharacterized protein n=1 Tax=Striga asiatica TaxID=4170 RepID=A0A5A7P4B9_STRAF|nr:hypothetical protein STAS_03088 [Striga asiatica]
MASTAPAKSQPLHNFTLSHLKWNKDAQSGAQHQRRRSVKSPSRRPAATSASPVGQSPLSETISATPPRHQSPLCDSSAPPSPREFHVLGDYLGRQWLFPARDPSRRTPVGPDPPFQFRRHDLAPESIASGKGRADSADNQRFHWKDSKSDGANSERGAPNFETKSKAKEADGAEIKRSKKILIKIPFRKDKIDDEIAQEEQKINEKFEDDDTREVREEGKIVNSNTDEETRIWNLRPRKPIRVSLSENWGPTRNHRPAMPEKNKGHPSRNVSSRSGENRDNGQKKGDREKKEKRKLSVFLSLTKEEIEEDIFSFTGSKPARRPKKRAKNVQKQVDTLYPGAWLISITADSYKVSENSLKVLLQASSLQHGLDAVN